MFFGVSKHCGSGRLLRGGGPSIRRSSENKPAPDFELTALDGAKVRLSDQRGKPVLLAFFAFG